MRQITCLFFALLISNSCFSQSETPDLVIDVKWTRSETSPSFLHGGVCHLFYGDSNDRAMWPAEDQIARCEAQARTQNLPLTASEPMPGVMRVLIYRVDSNLEVERRWDATYRRWANGIAKGFYYLTSQGCAVVVNKHKNVIGHEIKHCFDGLWHR